MIRSAGNGARSGCIVAFSVTKLSELGGNIPNSKTAMSIENCINVPTLARRYGHKRLVAGLSPSPNILASLLESSPQRIRCLLVKAVQGIAMHVVSHLGFVNVACPSLLSIPENLIGHLYKIFNPIKLDAAHI